MAKACRVIGITRMGGAAWTASEGHHGVVNHEEREVVTACVEITAPNAGKKERPHGPATDGSPLDRNSDARQRGG